MPRSNRGRRSQRHLAAARRFTRLGTERLEDRSLLAALMAYEIRILPPDGPLSGPDLTTVRLQESFDVVVTVQDLQPDGQGVFAGFLDIQYDANIAQLRVGEIQTIEIGPFSTAQPASSASGEFTIAFGGQTTAPIVYNANAEALAAEIKTRLEALSNVGPGKLQIRASGGGESALSFQVRFAGTMLGVDVPTMTVASQALAGPSAPGVSIAGNGNLTSDLAFQETWRSRIEPVAYPNVVRGSSQPNLINDVGAVGGLFPVGTAKRELVRGRFLASQMGSVTFRPDLTERDLPFHDTLLYTSPERGLELSEMDPGAAKTLFIANIPAIAVDDTVSLLEDSPATAIDVLANDTSAPASTSEIVAITQPVHGSVTFTPNRVTYTPAANFYGVTTFTYTLKNYLADPSAAMFAIGTVTISVTGVNDAPTLDPIGDPPAIKEDAVPSPLELTGISAGPGEPQSLTITATSSNPELIAPTIAYTPGAEAFVSYKPAANRSGTAVITVKVTDEGGTENSGADETTRTFTVTVTPVNDAPSFTAGENQLVTDEGGAQSVQGWAKAISAGPADEAGQTLTFSTSTSNESLFATLPAIDGTGRLTFTPAPNSSGTATVTVMLKDNGGTENSGIDTSPPQTFTIEVENPRPLQNSEKRQDVDGNDEISPLDALLIINYLNTDNPTKLTTAHSTKVSAAASSVNYYDVSGDNEIAPLDALLIINFLNAEANGEGEASADSGNGSHTWTDLIAALAEDIAGQSARRRRMS
jgi:hypothetical protein